MAIQVIHVGGDGSLGCTFLYEHFMGEASVDLSMDFSTGNFASDYRLNSIYYSIRRYRIVGIAGIFIYDLSMLLQLVNSKSRLNTNKYQF
ncbi:hypothetical protein [Acinetobacter sp. 226]|uniref:hypothetical protein n=1 Tax=Acinetobacter sp. 226 TaxID=3114699 RepID=UPI003A83CB12